jgi:hypothetical protein
MAQQRHVGSGRGAGCGNVHDGHDEEAREVVDEQVAECRSGQDERRGPGSRMTDINALAGFSLGIPT